MKTNAEYVTEWRYRTKAKLVAEAGGKCSRCGYDRCLRALVFHHRVPSEKDFSVMSSIKAIERLRAEAAKCDLVCANCHAELHDKRFSLESIAGDALAL